jgi:hypothetical protein
MHNGHLLFSLVKGSVLGGKKKRRGEEWWKQRAWLVPTAMI